MDSKADIADKAQAPNNDTVTHLAESQIRLQKLLVQVCKPQRKVLPDEPFMLMRPSRLQQSSHIDDDCELKHGRIMSSWLLQRRSFLDVA